MPGKHSARPGDGPAGDSTQVRDWRKRAIRTAAVVALTLTLTLGFRQYVGQNYTIPSASMTRTLAVGDEIFVDKLGWRMTGLHRGDVVVFDGAGSFDPAGQHTTYVKRIIGLPGDVIACCDAAGRVSVNSRPVTETYVYEPDRLPFGPFTVPAGDVFVAGDHRSDSNDSRFRGPVPIRSIIGRADAVIWPLNQLAGIDAGGYKIAR